MKVKNPMLNIRYLHCGEKYNYFWYTWKEIDFIDILQ